MPLPPLLRVGTGWIPITVTGPVDMIACFEGYAPILTVREDRTEANLQELSYPLKRARMTKWLGTN